MQTRRMLLIVALTGTCMWGAGRTLGAGEPTSCPFPLARSIAGDQALPLPFGATLTYFTQEQDYDIDRLRVKFATIPPALAAQLPAAAAAALAAGAPLDGSIMGSVRAENALQEANLRLDMWLLPFLNVFGIVGSLDGKTDVNTALLPGGLTVNYKGIVYGGGATLAAGRNNVFASLTGIYTGSALDTSDSTVTAWVVQPNLGYRFTNVAPLAGVAVWIGAMYQKAAEHHDGTTTVPPYGPVAYNVDLQERDPWNYTVGAHVDLTPCWQAEVEGGFGNRTHLSAGLTYRF